MTRRWRRHIGPATPARCVLAGCMLAWHTLAGATTPVYKCLVQGTVTYQAEPCRTGPAAPRPTLEQLTATRKRQAEAAETQRSDAVPAATPPSVAGVTPGASSPAPARPAGRASATPPAKAAAPMATPAAPAFRCDGRRLCTQMTSCDEAKYFLAHCPGVRMDGDRDGIPCEDQWCGKR